MRCTSLSPIICVLLLEGMQAARAGIADPLSLSIASFRRLAVCGIVHIATQSNIIVKKCDDYLVCAGCTNEGSSQSARCT